MKTINNLLFGLRITYRNHERPAVESESTDEREPSLSDAQTESGRKKILNAAREKIAQLRKEAEKGDFDSEERAERIQELIKAYELEGMDPIHDYDPNSRSGALAKRAGTLFNTLMEVEKKQAAEEREERENRRDAPEWLREAVLKTPKKRFKSALDEALTRMNDNPYTNMIIDRSGTGESRNPYLLDVYNRLAELDMKVRTAKTIDEVDRATREVLRIASPGAIDETMKSDWAYALVANEVGDVIESRNDMDPRELLRQINARIARLAEREPLKSQPANAVYRMQYRGIDLSVAKTGDEKYTASIDGIDEYYEHLHPRIAKYVHDREQEAENRRA